MLVLVLWLVLSSMWKYWFPLGLLWPWPLDIGDYSVDHREKASKQPLHCRGGTKCNNVRGCTCARLGDACPAAPASSTGEHVHGTIIPGTYHYSTVVIKTKICCVNIGGYMAFGSIVGSDKYVLLCVTMPPRNRGLVRAGVSLLGALHLGSRSVEYVVMEHDG